MNNLLNLKAQRVPYIVTFRFKNYPAYSRWWMHALHGLQHTCTLHIVAHTRAHVGLRCLYQRLHQGRPQSHRIIQSMDSTFVELLPLQSSFCSSSTFVAATNARNRSNAAMPRV